MYSLNAVASLARRANRASSYEPVLLEALVRSIRRRAGTTVDLRAIGHEFVALYWTQTVVFRLRQAPTLAHEPAVVRRIREIAQRTKIRDLTALAARDRARLDTKMAAILPVNVLDAFHVGKPESMSVLFTWQRGDAFIEISAGAHRFLSENATAIEAIANLWWARYLERVNVLAPSIIEKVERDGARRKSVVRYLRVLQEIDGNRCFYCETDLTLARTHIDHVIPWSFMLSDPAWDLVLACDSCNLAKSYTLPDRAFVDKLGSLHAVRSTLSTLTRASLLVVPGELERYYDAALSVEWPSGRTPALRST